jgi:hypothetical protein
MYWDDGDCWCRACPLIEPDPRQQRQAEPVQAATWAATEGLAQFRQASVACRIGVPVQSRAIFICKMRLSPSLKLGKVEHCAYQTLET